MWRLDYHLLIQLQRRLAHPEVDLAALIIIAGCLLALAAVAAVLLWRRERVGRVLAAALTLTGAACLALQPLVARPAPHWTRPLLTPPEPWAYPCIAAALGWCAALVLVLELRCRGCTVAALLGAALLSLGPLVLGWSHLSDVAGAAVLGAATGAAAHGLSLAGVSWTRRLRWLVWPQTSLMLMATQLAYLDLLPLSLSFPYADKLMHFLMFGLAAFWLHLWLDGRRLRLGPLRPPLALLIAFGLALPEELAQHFARARSLEALDLISDLAGMLVFTWLAALVLRRGSAHPKEAQRVAAHDPR